MFGQNLRHFIKAQKKYVAIAVIVTVIVAILINRRAFQYADLFQSVIQSVQDHNQQAFFTALIGLIILELVLFVVRLCTDTLKIKYRGYMNLTIRLFGVDKVVDMNYQNAAKLGSGKLMQIIHSGMESYSYLIYDGMTTLIEVGVSLAIVIYLLSSQNIIFLGTIVAGIMTIVVLQKYIFAHLKQARDRDVILNEAYTKQTAKILMNFILLKIYNLKQQELDKLYEVGMNRVNNYQWIKFWFNGIASIANLFFLFLLLGSLRYIGFGIAAGSIDLGFLFVLTGVFTHARSELYRLGLFVAELSEKLTYIQRFDDITSQKHIQPDTSGYNYPVGGSVSYNAVGFGYEGGTGDLLLEDFSLTIQSGQKVAIVGRSGSGKSTLFKLMTKMLEPTQGTIMLGNTDIATMPIEDIYKKVGYFYQEPLVFDASLTENITFTSPVSPAKVTQALHLCALDHLSPDTIIGEHGLLLSGGEKQRLALARAFVFDYDVLILDEPTSNLDPELEQRLLLNIFEHYKDKTIIVISHRPFILDYVDRIITIKKGIIVEDRMNTLSQDSHAI